MMATLWPLSSRMWASVDPTRPHPMITMCTVVLPGAVRSAWLRLDLRNLHMAGRGKELLDPSDGSYFLHPHTRVGFHGRFTDYHHRSVEGSRPRQEAPAG